MRNCPFNLQALGGILPTLIVTVSLLGFMQTWGLVIYPDLNDFPDWANSTNAKVD